MQYWMLLTGCKALAVALILCTSAARAADDLATILAAATRQWRQDVTFSCRYEFHEGFFDSKHDALTSETIENASDYLFAAGELHKRDDSLRMSAAFDRVPDLSESEGTTAGPLSFEYSSTHDILIEYLPKQGGLAGSAFVIARPSTSDSGTYLMSTHAERIIDPLTFCGGLGKVSLSKVIDDNSSRAGFTISEGSHDNFLDVNVRYRFDAIDISHTFSFLETTNPPTLAQHHMRSIGGDGQATFEMTTQATDFVACPGGLVPRSVRHVFGPIPLVDGGEQWLCRLWKTNDLGNSRPSNRSFHVEIPRGVTVAGLKNKPSSSKLQSLNPRDYSIADIDFGEGVENVATPYISPFLIRMLLISQGMLVLLFAIWLYRRKRRIR